MSEEPASWDDAFESIVRQMLPLLPPHAPLRGNLDMMAAGLGSLGAVELLATVQDHYGIVFADHEIAQQTVDTPAALWSTVQGHLA